MYLDTDKFLLSSKLYSGHCIDLYRNAFGESMPPNVMKLAADTGKVNQLYLDMLKAVRVKRKIDSWDSYAINLAKHLIAK